MLLSLSDHDALEQEMPRWLMLDTIALLRLSSADFRLSSRFERNVESSLLVGLRILPATMV